MILNIIIAILMIGLIILIHEFGHFIVAKANGVAVVEFSIGFGPKLFSVKKGDTEYCLKLIPFGGACMMLGDDIMAEPDEQLTDDGGADSESDEEADSSEKTKAERREGLLKEYDADKAFSAKPVWSRIAIIAAGPLFNFLLAFIFAVIIIGSVGTDPCTVDVVEENSPAAEAGLQVGDEITKINNNGISFSKEYAFYKYYHADETMNITYVREISQVKHKYSPLVSYFALIDLSYHPRNYNLAQSRIHLLNRNWLLVKIPAVEHILI